MPQRRSLPLPTLAQATFELPAMRRRYAALGVVAIVTISILAYLPSLSGGFILDDDLLLTNNHLIKAPDGLWRFWYTTQQPDYVPLTSSTLWLEWRLWGTNPVGYRITNLVLHIGACLLLWRLLGQLSIPGGFLAALLFAIHPVNVESVAWVEQRKNTLSLVLFLCSMLAYFRAEKLREASQPKEMSPTQSLLRAEFPYWMSLLAFALAMYSKGSAAVLPLALLLVVWWRRGRLTRSDILRIAPFFLVAAVLTPLIVWFVTHNSEQSVRSATFPERLLQAGAVVWFYLSKALVPIELIFVYPQWNIQIGSMLWWLPLAALVFVTLLLVRCRRLPYGGALLLAWLLFVVALLPVLGFTDPGYMRFSPVADHYQQLALLSVVTVISALWNAWYVRTNRICKLPAVGTAAVVVTILTMLTWKQDRLYADAIDLYTATLAKNPNCAVIRNNLGVALVAADRLQEASQQYREALRIDPDYPDAHNNLGCFLFREGRYQDAIYEFQQAVALPEAYFNMARALQKLNRSPEAIQQYRLGLQLQPYHAQAQYELGRLLCETNQPDEAIAHFQEALRLEPNHRDIHYDLGNAFAQLNQPQEAIAQYRQVLEFNSEQFWARNNLGVALAQTGRPQEAIEQFQGALRSRPDFVDAWKNLAEALAKTGRGAEALNAAGKALELARQQGNWELAKEIENWLSSNRSLSEESQNRLPPNPTLPQP